ncbi:MAG: hypothetical protein U0168_14635 [Nannocystaceae bacterium]
MRSRPAPNPELQARSGPFGEAYQIADDLLDLVGSAPTELGKPRVRTSCMRGPAPRSS